ncbi:MAG: acyl-CoA dehydrogenase [Candidatus Lokiarchaeota archaeon]|nr:acyl-CoA dehydrogenase [Candidatus Lokiarchaeota archaeon]
MNGKKGKVQCIDDEILKKLSLPTRNKFLSYNLANFLKSEHLQFLKQAQAFFENFEKDNCITHNEDFYEWVPEIGKHGYISRLHKFEKVNLNYEPYGMTAEFMRILAMEFFDPQLTMSTGATAIAVNPILLHNDDVEVRLRAVKELVTGEKVGAIVITEPERGSDAVRMQTTCEELEDGSFLLNGEKIYQTNGSKAGWAVVYAVSEKNNGNTMAQFLVDTSLNGWTAERINIPWTPRMHIAKEYFNNLRISSNCVLGKPGEGRSHLFEGLNLERLTIVCLNIAEAWNAITHAVIYANMRKQFDKEILKYQGVGFPLADLWAQTTSLTLATLNVSKMVDDKLEQLGTLPKDFNLALGTTASQLKFLSAKLSERVVYECANLMGGAGVCDNTLMQDLLGISRIQEIGGGTRQVQSHIMTTSLRELFKLL